MRVQILKITEGLHRHRRTGHGIIIGSGFFQAPAQHLPGAAA